jgi:ParB family chromosome partitioning protein
MATKHDEFDDFLGDPDDTAIVDTRADGRLLRVPLGRLAPNLVNPRTDFGTEDQLIDFGKSLARRQNQACPVVSRSAYLRLWPDHASQIGNVDYVLVSGERRYRGAAAVGLAALDCVVDDNVAADRKTFMEAVVSENVDRQNFDPVEEAYAVQALVAEFGSNRAVAQHFERVDGWVTQRVLLTHLSHEVQDLVRNKTIPLEAARSLGKMARDKDWSARDQLEWWESEQERRAAASAAKAAARRAARAQTPPSASPPLPADPSKHPEVDGSFTAVKPPAPLAPEAAPVGGSGARQRPEPATVTVQAETPATTAPSIPAQEPSLVNGRKPDLERPGEAAASGASQEASDGPLLKRFPYDDGRTAAMHLIHKMPLDEFGKMLPLLIAHWERETEAAN